MYTILYVDALKMLYFECDRDLRSFKSELKVYPVDGMDRYNLVSFYEN